MNKSLILLIVFILIWLLLEIGSYFAIRQFYVQQKSSLKTFNWIWWIASVGIYTLVFTSRIYESNYVRNILVNIFFFVIIIKLFIAFAFGLSTFIQWIASFFSSLEPNYSQDRRKFAAQISLMVGAIPFTTMIYGLFRTAYNFKLHKVKIVLPNVPKAFDGFKIVQISDIHTGSLQQQWQLEKAVNLILEQKPDLVVFTGDLVNNRSDEALPYLETLKKINAPFGVYSILGNHDYGDYEPWSSDDEKIKNMDLMYDIHKQLNWRLLLNESVSIQKGEDSIALIGVENWGANLRFKKYGNMQKANQGTEQSSFKILLSHDPSHWSYEVNKMYKDVDLTLSGHTHGFQFGVEIPGFKWSPSQYVYPQWSGLYKDGKQFLYVNRGLGCIGYMGRIGIQPEITVITLSQE
jgi:predicted MPP superfamily phosphohydrolase